jgi:hypothetical protein
MLAFLSRRVGVLVVSLIIGEGELIRADGMLGR